MEERDIFFEAIEITDPTLQRAFLENACAGDRALHNRLKDLLGMHGKSGSFLNSPAIEQIIVASSSAFPANDSSLKREDSQQTSDVAGDDVGADLLNFLQASSQPDSVGRLGNYDVKQILGRGAFGVVLLAFDDKLQRKVAIKVISPALLSNSSVRQRFLREARAFAAVRDPNTVQIYAIEEQPVPYLVMEYIPGQTIQQRIDERGPMSVREVVQVGQQIASGLAAAHAVGLIHRDIKPANILLEDCGTDRVKITDFGLARALDAASLTQADVRAGTPMFMSPEQALGEVFDHRTDLFSLGSVLYLMLCGQPPFQATTTSGLLKRVVEQAPVPIQEIVPNAPAWLCQIINQLHAKTPEDRFASARELANLLNHCLMDFDRGQVPSIAGFQSPTNPRTQRLRNSPWLILGIAATLLLATLMYLMNQESPIQSVDTLPQKINPIETPTETIKSIEPPSQNEESSTTSIELGPRIKPGNMGDGSFTDLSFHDHVLRLDATSGSRQLWINFPDVQGEVMTIVTQFRAAEPADFGMGKLIFMPDQGQQFAAVIVFGPKGYEVYIESSAKTVADSDKVRFQGADATEWNELTFEISAEKYSYTLNGKPIGERPRESRQSGYVAISCISSLCEMKDLRVMQGTAPRTAGVR